MKARNNMVETSVWEIIKAAVQWLLVPAVASLAFFVRKYIHRIDHMEQQVKDIEIRTAVVESKIDDIREDLKEIKHGVNRLIDRRADDRK